MVDYLRISATFLDPRFHGRGDRGLSEWPPSPLRMMQAIVAANTDQIGTDGPLDRAIQWLERQPPPVILAPRSEEAAAYCLSVPNNAMDLIGKAWLRGNYFGTGDSNPATHRTMKTVRPLRMVEDDNHTVHYLWPLNQAPPTEFMTAIFDAVRRIVALGWGIDLVVGNADRIDNAAMLRLPGERWSSTSSATPTELRVPKAGTLDAIRDRYTAFICRTSDDGFVPVPPLTTFEVIGYRRPGDPVGRPHAVFELRHDDGAYCRYSQRKLIHIAGMVRHVARQTMLTAPPPGVEDDWIERYVVGHRPKGGTNHRQLSYIPLPSIGHEHADQIVRRVMIAAPVGDDAWLEHIARRLAGRQLQPDPERGADFGDAGPPTLVRLSRDNISQRYTQPANCWASVTPIILPGHDDRKSGKTRKLIEVALAQSGIEQSCEFEWSAHSIFRKSFSAHKYDKYRKPIGYFRPDHLVTQTAVHLKLQFSHDLRVPGPLTIGAGRHCGFGLMAAAES